jgi:hypothetical protein
MQRPEQDKDAAQAKLEVIQAKINHYIENPDGLSMADYDSMMDKLFGAKREAWAVLNN